MSIEVVELVNKIDVVGGDTVVVVEEQIETIEIGVVGPQGAPGSGVLVREAPLGVTDGANRVFTASQVFIIDSTMIYLNGLLLSTPFDYQETGPTEVTLDEAPLSGDRLAIVYAVEA